MANKFEAEVDVEMGSNGNVKNSQVVTSPQDIMVKPYFATVDQVTAYYNTSIVSGLLPVDVEGRRAVFGRNALKGNRSVNPFLLFLSHLFNVMSIILMIAVALALAVEEWIEGGVIALIVVLNTCVGFYQEYSSEQTMQALRRLSSPMARAVREGTVVEVQADELVPGDIIHLKEGDQVPADVRVISVVAFSVEEAILTGESVAVTKVVEPMSTDGKTAAQRQEATLGVGDRKNMAFFGCVVARGRALAIVTATGMKTELGQIAQSIGFVP
ncbi:potassium sodium efflux p-type fungal-type, partial [Nannochloropsis oceanica]